MDVEDDRPDYKETPLDEKQDAKSLSSCLEKALHRICACGPNLGSTWEEKQQETILARRRCSCKRASNLTHIADSAAMITALWTPATMRSKFARQQARKPDHRQLHLRHRNER